MDRTPRSHTARLDLVDLSRGAWMQTVAITKARARLADLIRRAEAGQAVCITRRGRPVAKLVAFTDHEPPTMQPSDWVAFSKAWRQSAQDEGLDLVSDAELNALRRGDLGKPLDRTQVIDADR